MPIWRDIHTTLLGEITAGRYHTGDKLPTEKELSLRFGVNRHTVRRALAELTAEGVVYVRRGSGAYVAQGMVDYKLGARVKFSQNITELGRTPHHVLVAAVTVAADEVAARHLAVKTGAPLTVLETLNQVDDLPLVVSRSLFPSARFPDLVEQFQECGSISAALRRYGVTDYRRAWTRITARAPSRALAMQLRQIETQPVLHVECLNLDMSGQPIEYSTSEWCSARVQFVLEN